MSVIASGPFIDWEELTGQSAFVVDLVSIPIFSAVAGLITNWTGVIMLFAPVFFTGFYVPGLRSVFPFLPRKVQILPIFAPNGILGFQGFIPCRAEKMASLIVDMSIARIGSIRDFYEELGPAELADRLADALRPNIRQLAEDIIESEHRTLWRSLPVAVQNQTLRTLDERLPQISRRVFAKIGENISDLLNVKLMVVNHLRRNPAVLVGIIKGMGAPELRFMVKIGALGFFFGIPLALYISWVREAHPPVLSAVPMWLVVLAGAALIGIVVNYLAVKVVFEPGDPKPRYRYPWKQGLFPKRQHEAAAEISLMLAREVMTVPNFANELLFGASGDKTALLIEEAVAEEVEQLLTPIATVTARSLGIVNVGVLERKASLAAVELAPDLLSFDEFSERREKKIADFAAEKFRALPPHEFSEMLYSAIEQDAWLLYVHGGVLGIAVGALHLLLFGW
ncbi:hypothetical protein [Mycobacterium bourgelatii]|uniref:DUF445 domain-containing protein n=1 Tax=Mycobacterium bourgelatii TaxID=1273442 RepID=A0A7I9YX74_MYCBU|nr:hypothetical protein [Mycobacterium bourgelatii]MCV6973122.1 hypothetical protein [Mycobacterium bourgelatii]GFG93156.1 hypothetical protein MBOU_51980 [Mycobacterium bourgelatii]